jgi:hypothetical protein
MEGKITLENTTENADEVSCTVYAVWPGDAVRSKTGGRDKLEAPT